MAFGEQFEAVLAAAKAGAEWAITALYRDLHPRLLRYLRVQEPNDAEDLASETWLAVASDLPRFEGDEVAFRRWLFTIARHRLIDLRRRTASRRTDLVAGHWLDGLDGTRDTQAEALSGLATEAALARIATLPPDQAEVVLLRVLAGLDANDVAEIMGKPPGTVRVLQYRALKRLADTLAQTVVTL